MENNNYIAINQALHGYNNGHALLASSIELSSETKRLMLPISDMSGGSMQVGFETYLTGYPIKEENVYALAKTWYAPEMKRPGCVWTHTLLIDFGDLPKINDTDLVLSLFNRPKNLELEVGKYSAALQYRPDQIGQDYIDVTKNVEDKNGLIKSILLNLYEDSTNTLFIKGTSSKEFEKIFLAIWKQQWPRLRRNFSFCTGAISPRSFDGNLLDLQIVSSKLDSVYATSKDIAVIESNGIDLLVQKDWVDLAYENLLFPTKPLVSFFNFFGSDLIARRTAFKALAQTFLYFNGTMPNLADCIKYTAEQFPSMKEANSLKSAIFGSQISPFNYILPRYEESSVLHVFSTTIHFTSFDYEKLNLRERFYTFITKLADDKIKFLKNLIRQDLNPFGESILTELASLLEKNEKLHLIWQDKNLSSVFISLNPKLSYDKRFWIENQSNQTEIIHSLQAMAISINLDWQLILNILIEINSNIDLKIFDEYNLNIEGSILNWIDKNPSKTIRANWLNILHRNPRASLDWLNTQNKPQNRTIETLVKVLDPNSKLFAKYEQYVWIDYISKFTKSQLHEISLEIHCFCLTIALNSNHEHSQKLFEASFEFVYYALATDNVNYSLWKNIEIHTKQLSLWKNWDKCKKIINAIVDHYLKNSWNIKTLANSLSSVELSDRILTQYKKRK